MSEPSADRDPGQGHDALPAVLRGERIRPAYMAEPNGLESIAQWDIVEPKAVEGPASGVGGIISEATLGNTELAAEKVMSKAADFLSLYAPIVERADGCLD